MILGGALRCEARPMAKLRTVVHTVEIGAALERDWLVKWDQELSRTVKAPHLDRLGLKLIVHGEGRLDLHSVGMDLSASEFR